MLTHTESTNRNAVTCIEPCVEDAKYLVDQLQTKLHQYPNKRLRHVFTALANGDAAVGLLAFYIWRRRARRWK